jgi:ubiquilin
MEQISVLSVKQEISNQQQDCPPERQRLIYKGRILADERTLSDYGVVNGATLHLVKSRSATAAATTAAGPTTTTPTSTTTPTTAPTTTPNNPPFQMPPNPFASTTMPPPDQMQQMMNSPMMQSFMDNPDLMRSIMEANPQMRQLMQENPQLREVMNNPELMRQSMEMMRNPNAMQHMMRSQDLAMSQLENMYVHTKQYTLQRNATFWKKKTERISALSRFREYSHVSFSFVCFVITGRVDFRLFQACIAIYKNH